jgi:hypothetical protein
VSSKWALILPGSIAVVIAGLALAPGAADGLTWLAFVAIPPLAALALGWAMRGARPWLAVLVVPLLAVPMIVVNQSDPFIDPAVADGCAVILSALSCVTLGRLLAAVAPTWALEAGIVAMAAIDAILVFSHGLQQPNSVLVTAVPSVSGFDLPQLQVANFHFAQIGYGDLFIAGVLGGVVALRNGPALTLALWTLIATLAFDQLFRVRDELPATVPVAVVTVGWAIIRSRGYTGRSWSGGRPRRAAEP